MYIDYNQLRPEMELSLRLVLTMDDFRKIKKHGLSHEIRDNHTHIWVRARVIKMLETGAVLEYPKLTDEEGNSLEGRVISRKNAYERFRSLN